MEGSTQPATGKVSNLWETGSPKVSRLYLLFRNISPATACGRYEIRSWRFFFYLNSPQNSHCFLSEPQKMTCPLILLFYRGKMQRVEGTPLNTPLFCPLEPCHYYPCLHHPWSMAEVALLLPQPHSSIIYGYHMSLSHLYLWLLLCPGAFSLVHKACPS